MLPLWGDALLASVYCFHALLWTAPPLVPCIQCFYTTVLWTVPALIVQLTFTFWSNFSALASPPRRRRLAVSFMDRSSPPSGRLAAVLDRCLRFALLWPNGISLPRPVPALRRARFAAFAAHTISPLHRGAIPYLLRPDFAQHTALALPRHPRATGRYRRASATHIRATKPSVHLQQGFSHGRGVVSNSSLHYNSSDATRRRSVTAELYRSSSNGTRSTRVVGSGVTSISRESGGRLPTHAWSNR